jgi:hypothetical protein
MVTVEIKKWQDIQEDYKGTLVLGNGSSMAIDKKFEYKELYQKSLDEKWIKDEIKKIFEDFNTKDFERILKSLYDASRVVESLHGANAKKTIDKAYENVRNSLIKAVQGVHPNYNEVKDDISVIARRIQVTSDAGKIGQAA